MPNPFLIETLPLDSPFCDRQEEIRRLLSFAESGTNAVLFSPRRYRKTSLALRVQAMLSEKGYVTIYCQLFGVDSVSDAASRMARSILGAIHARESLLEKDKKFLRYFSAFRPVFKPSEDGVSVTVEPSSLEKPAELLERILLAMFSDRNRPLFQSAINLELPHLPHEDIIPFLGGLFSKERKDCPEKVRADISFKVDRHPYYVQRLAREVYDLGKEKISQEDVDQAPENLIDSERYAFEAVLSRLTTQQVRVIRTLAAFPAKEMLSGECIAKCALPPSSVQLARNRLKMEDLIEQEKKTGTWKVVDPVYAMWLNKL